MRGVHTRCIAAAAAMALLAAGLTIAGATPAAASGDTTERVSVASDGTQSNGTSRGTDLSGNGAIVAFSSNATNLTAGANSHWSIYVHDRGTGITEQVSVASADSATPGAANNSSAGDPSISRDGYLVAFRSLANNLVDDDSGTIQDVFVHDRHTGITRLISRSASTGLPGNGRSDNPEISADGRHVVFSSAASDLVAGDTNGVEDVFIHHLETGVTELVSTAPGGTQGTTASNQPAVNADGTVVAFATNDAFDAADADSGARDVYVRDFAEGTTELMSVPTSGLTWNVGITNETGKPVISGDGSRVGFMNFGTAWVRDRPTSTTIVASGNTRVEAGRMSDDGRWYLQWEYTTNCTSCSFYPWLFDVDTGDRMNVGLTEGGTVSDAGAVFATERPGISDDGSVVGFHSGGTDLVADDTNGTDDTFVRGPASADTGPPPAPVVDASPSPAQTGEDITFTAIADDSTTGGSVITGLEYQTDGGVWTAMTALDDAFDEVSETGVATISFTTEAIHQACARATDAAGNTSTASCLDIPVEDPATNLPPTIDPIPDQEVFTGQEASFTATATDPDGDDSLITWSLGSTAPVDATIGASSGAFSWTPTSAGAAAFDVVATDGLGAASSDSVTITVTDPPTAGAIAFTSDRDGDYDLWTVDPGAAPEQVANLSGDDQYPRWSPDGTRLAFIKNPNTTSGRLWIIDADGTNPTQLASVQARFAPAWSPDGAEIFFTANSGDGDFDVHGVAPDGTGLRKVADTTTSETYITWVGGRLAVDRGSDLVLVDPVTGLDLGSYAIGNAVGYDGEPSGNRVAIAQSTSTTTRRIALVDTADGSVTGLTDGTDADGHPGWSPDAQALVFSRNATEGSDLYTIAVDGTGLTQITTDPAWDFGGDWAGADDPPSPPAIEVFISEHIGVADTVSALPAIQVFISERVGVSDQITAPPTIQVFISERIGVSDQITAPPTIQVFISERIGVGGDTRARFPLDGISDSELLPGESVDVTGTGFEPDSDIDIGLESEFLLLQTIVAGPDGTFQVTVDIPPPDELPAGFAGDHALLARGIDPNGDPHELRFPVSILAPVDVELSRANPGVLEQSSDGSFVLQATLSDSWGELTDERPSLDDFSMTLEPVGPGSGIEGACDEVSFGGKDPSQWEMRVECTFDHAAVGENTYVVVASIDDGIPLFWGQDEGVLTVVDAAGGAISGGGTFTWPDAGGHTEFGFSLRTNRKGTNVIGGFAVIRELSDGSKYRIVSNAVEGMSVVDDDQPAWATFTAKVTYQAPGMSEPEGNHQVVVYVEDVDAGPDRIWIEVRDKDRRVVDVSSFPAPATENAVDIGSGDIMIPDNGKKGGRR